MTEIVRIPFHGDEILAVDVNGQPFVVLKPAVDGLGLDYSAQYMKLRGRSWATVVLRPMVAEDGKTREMVTVSLRTFLMLLATVDEKRVAANVKDKLVMYQAEVADAIEAYWTTGVAANPRAEVAVPSSQLDVIAAVVGEMQRMERDLADSRAEVRAIGSRTEEAIATVTEIAARQDAIEGKHDWFAGLGYARLQGWSTDRKFLQRLGTRAGRIGRAAGLKVSKVQHGLYGEVNQWPAWCWEAAYEELGEAS